MKAMSIIKNIRVKYADKYMRSINSDKDAYINWLQDEYAELVMKQANEAERSSDKCHIQNVMAMLPDEKAALKHAVDAIYFADNSDYLSGLYGVVRSLTGLDEPSEEDIKKLFKELNPE